MQLKYIARNFQENNKIEKKIREFNYGFGFLKSYLAFLVVKGHNFNNKSTKNKLILTITRHKIPHVPSFFIISFYFTCNNLLSSNIKIFFKRLERLLIPYIIWPIAIWILNHIVNLEKNHSLNYSFKSLKLQLLYGHVYMSQFWFLWDLIIITILFYIISFIFKKNSLFIFHILLILSYLSQYSGYGYKTFFLTFPYYKRYTYARLFGMIPCGTIGFTLGFYNIIHNFQKCKIKTLFLSIMIYNILNNYNIFVVQPGELYYGINRNINALCIIFIFSLFPSNNFKNECLKKVFRLITNYSAGVFYLHISIKKFFIPYLEDAKNGTFFWVIINYLICYFICFCGMLIFGKTFIKYLFC